MHTIHSLKKKNVSILCVKTISFAVYQHTKHRLHKRQHWEWKMRRTAETKQDLN